jgi:mono/diheme cytochrome c family protein
MAARTLRAFNRALAATAALCACFGAHAQPTPTFAEVAQILAERCVVCHQGDAAPLGLRLDSYSGAMKGSQKGPVVKPGEARASELVRRIRGESLPRMPLIGPPWLAEPQIALIERWINAGAAEGAQTTAKAAPKEKRPGGPLTYADVAPILVGRCAKCHTENGLMGTAPEGYRLSSYRDTISAADRARIVPGNPNASELVRRIRGESRPRMPFDGPPYLSAGEIAQVEKWIADGVRDEEGRPAPVPAGARVRFRGADEVRGVVQPDGSISVTRTRRR